MNKLTLSGGAVIAIGITIGIFLFFNALQRPPLAEYEISTNGIIDLDITMPGSYLLKQGRDKLSAEPTIKITKQANNHTLEVITNQDLSNWALAKIEIPNSGKYSLEVESVSDTTLKLQLPDPEAQLRALGYAPLTILITLALGIAMITIAKTLPKDDHSLSRSEKTWALFAHLSAYCGLFMQLLNVIAPLIIWFKFRKQNIYIAQHAQHAINFQLSMTIYFIVCFVLATLTPLATILIALLFLLNINCIVIAAIYAMHGQTFRYPLSMKLLGLLS